MNIWILTPPEENSVLSFHLQISVQCTASCYGSAAPGIPPDCHLSSPSLHTLSLPSCLCNSSVVSYCDPTVQQKILARDRVSQNSRGKWLKPCCPFWSDSISTSTATYKNKNAVLSARNFSRQSRVSVRILHMSAALLSNNKLLSLSQRVQEVPFPSLGTTGK